MRRVYIIGILAALVLFLVISALLARVFNANSAEQSAITALVQSEARGDPNAVVGDIADCRTDAACRQRAATNAAALKHAGAVSIIQLQPSTSFSLGGTEGTARVAWNTSSYGLPIVQCVKVRRGGNPISGLNVELLVVSHRIASDAACPARY
ncbi:MAG TPA: hypothetical protein VHZ27_02550 [Solirubrobacteraceae bacterium]|jgi:hypothetical protein|nr:hypothetical protein [Solirubrobacteraceae bacterium]